MMRRWISLVPSKMVVSQAYELADRLRSYELLITEVAAGR